MKRVIDVSLLELVKVLKKAEFMYGLLGLGVLGLGMAYGAYMYPDSFGAENVIGFYGNFAGFLIMYLSAKSLGEEFDLKTATFVFTSRSTRGKIIIAKMISLILASAIVGLCGGVIYDVSIIICREPWTMSILSLNLLKTVFDYIIYGFGLGALGILLTCVHTSTITSFVYLVILFWMFPGILDLIAHKLSFVGAAMDYMVFCLANEVIMNQNDCLKNILVFIVSGFIFMIMSVEILRKKDL